MSTTKKRPGAPGTVPPPDDFDEEAPTAIVPGKQRVDMPHEFDPGGDLEEEVTGVPDEPRPAPQDPDDDTAPTKDS